MSAQAYKDKEFVNSQFPSSLSSFGVSTIEERRTPELIFAFVEPIGGGAQKCIETLSDILKSARYNYIIN